MTTHIYIYNLLNLFWNLYFKWNKYFLNLLFRAHWPWFQLSVPICLLLYWLCRKPKNCIMSTLHMDDTSPGLHEPLLRPTNTTLKGRSRSGLLPDSAWFPGNSSSPGPSACTFPRDKVIFQNPLDRHCTEETLNLRPAGEHSKEADLFWDSLLVSESSLLLETSSCNFAQLATLNINQSHMFVSFCQTAPANSSIIPLGSQRVPGFSISGCSGLWVTAL